MKSVVLRAEDKGGGGVLVRAVRGVMVGEAGKILFERKSNIIAQALNSIIIMILIYNYVVYLLCYLLYHSYEQLFDKNEGF